VNKNVTNIDAHHVCLMNKDSQYVTEWFQSPSEIENTTSHHCSHHSHRLKMKYNPCISVSQSKMKYPIHCVIVLRCFR